jgi:TRAP-type C4-dicarboxylate transport system permease large subunit
MYTVTSIANVRLEDYTREALPLFAALVSALLLVTFVPALSLWLAGLVFG